MREDTFKRDLSDEEMKIYHLFRKMQDAMIDKDMDLLRQLISDNAKFVHMSGAVQSKEEYLKDIETGRLDYRKTVLKDVDVEINEDKAVITCTAYLTARAYGASGTFPMNVSSTYQKNGDTWTFIGH